MLRGIFINTNSHTMAKKDWWSYIVDHVDNCYKYNPDITMPMLYAAAAAKGKLSVTETNAPVDGALLSLEPESIADFEWVTCNSRLKKRVASWKASSVEHVNVECAADGTLGEAREILTNYDSVTLVREYHHRIGVLRHHSGNERSEQAYRQFVLLSLAEALIELPKSFYAEKFMDLFAYILCKSGIQPGRPRLTIARTLCAMLDYDGEGVVYNPFAGCGIAASMIGAGEALYADGDCDDKLLAAMRLLNYGAGGCNDHVIRRDSSQWLTEVTPKYVISTYLGNIDARPAFDFCLGKCLETLPEGGRYAGVAKAEVVFENQSPEMKEAIARDWVDTILLLPFGEVCVLFNAGKDSDQKGKVRFADMTQPLLEDLPPVDVLESDSDCRILKTSALKKKGYLRSLVVSDMDGFGGWEQVKIKDVLKPLKKSTYDLSKFESDDRILASIPKDSESEFIIPTRFNKERISVLFEPAYHITEDVVVMNSYGRLSPRVYNVDDGEVFMVDGYAFKFMDNPYVTLQMLVDELDFPYIEKQLFPYGVDSMLPGHITLKQIMDLTLLIDPDDMPMNASSSYDSLDFSDFGSSDSSCFNPFASGEYEQPASEAILRLAPEQNLQNGYVQYSGLKYLSKGGFGITYRANKFNRFTGESGTIVLKEFFPSRCAKRDDRGIHIEFAPWVCVGDEKAKFKQEAQAMMVMGHDLDKHIMHVNDIFNIEATNTVYYEMKYYEKGSMMDMIKSNSIPSEEMVINRIIVPMCKAMHTIHSDPYNMLHLDIKPENILIDENGYATLIDFGLSRRYTEEISGVGGTPYYESPEQYVNDVDNLGPWSDIYSMAASFYEIFSRNSRFTEIYDENGAYDMMHDNMECSEQTKVAILTALMGDFTRRPASAQEFVNMFPGCEDIKL